jgi:hypothetical protein
VIGKSFDIYFHLWSYGSPHWEREKRLWEEEEAKSWNYVMSKRQKQASKKALKKRVHFAKNLVQDSPKVKFKPLMSVQSIKIGDISVDLSKAFDLNSSSRAHGILRNNVMDFSGDFSSLDGISSGQSCTNVSDLPSNGSSPMARATPTGQRCSSAPQAVDALELQLINGSFKSFLVTNGILQHGGCSRCFAFNRRRYDCRGKIRCAACFKSGHIFKFCLTKAQPRIAWRPKSVGVSCQPDPKVERSSHYCQPISEGEESPRSAEETVPNSVSPPIHRSATANPLSSSKPELRSPAPSSPAAGQGDGDVANFDVDPVPFVPEGMNVMVWAQPARGRIIFSANPPR